MNSRLDEQRIRILYEAAMTKPPEERAAYVAGAAGTDAEVRARVSALISGQQDTVLPGHEPTNDETAAVLDTGTQIGGYRIERPLGAGGMGVVYFATDTRLNRPAAIKLLRESRADSEARRRFEREARLVSSLNHPHIVTVYDAGEYQDRPYLVTEYVDGGTLRLWAAVPRGWQGVVDLLVGVADGIAAAHEAGILHRDIKPENILLAKNGYAKLADFGIAKLLETDPVENPEPQRAGDHSTHVGTAAYMSPEQLQGLPLDARSDVYSFGLILHELLAGRRIETGAPGLPRTFPPLPAGLPAALRALVTKALEDEPGRRQQTMRELVADLRRIARAPEPAAPRTFARPVAYVAAVLATLLAGLLVRDYLQAPRELPPNARAVAVLPFVNETNDEDDASISERLSDKLRDRLQELPGFDVIGRVSSLSFGHPQVDTRTIAKTLGAGRLINGTLRREGAMLAVRVEVVDDKGVIARTFSYEEPDTALLALQRKIAADVGSFLAPESAASVGTDTDSESERANKLIVVGSHLEHEALADEPSIDSEKLRKAVDLYQRATLADPGSLEAHTRLAAASLINGDTAGAAPALQRALDIAATLSPGAESAELSDVYQTAALYLVATRSAGAETHYQRALELNPSNTEALVGYGQWLLTNSRSPEAQRYFKDAIRLEPLSLSRYVDYAEYLGTRDLVAELRELARDIELRFPDGRGYVKLARVYELTGDLDVGIAYGLKGYRALREQAAQPARSEAAHRQMLDDARGQLMELYAKIGDFDRAAQAEPDAGIGQLLLRGEYQKLIDVAQERMIGHPEDRETQYYLAFAYNATGDYRTAEYLLSQLSFPSPELTGPAGPAAEAQTFYIDALQSLGGNDVRVAELAKRRAEKMFVLGTGIDASWWVNTILACTDVQLGRIPDALAALGRVQEAHGWPNLPLLKDSPCFRRVAKEPRYIALLDRLAERQRTLRARLPATLEEYGVADVRL